MGRMIWGIFAFALGLLLVFVFVVIVIAAVKWLRGKSSPIVIEHREGGLNVLEKRYARGEISKDEYETIKRNLE